jgi:hypothetical protein
MPTLPAFYAENVTVVFATTKSVRGNIVSDLTGNTVTGIQVQNCTTARVKNNKSLRIRSKTNTSRGFYFDNITDLLAVYNVASRCDTGISIGSITTLNFYNLTAHNCTTCVATNSSGSFFNIAFSAYEDWRNYKNNTGFSVTPGATVSYNYVIHYNLGDLDVGTVSAGSTVSEQQILYMDEPNDDLTPDHISVLVNAGTDNPLRTSSPDIGGIESDITTELTADRKYHYELLDNSFWDIDNDVSGEVTFIKSYQSRILANSEAAEQTVERDFYIKTADSTERFREVFPAFRKYASATKFRKRVTDLWYATQNGGTLFSLNNSIGGYNLFPSFFRRIEDVDAGWVIAESYVGEDNWLMGMEALKYGIEIDVLGTSTMSTATSGEAYSNVMASIADLGPTRWFLHDEPQPTSYLLFTDMWNNFENCTLTNMIYNDDFNISPDVALTNGQVLTPLIPTATITATGAPSGAVEISLLDRIWSETTTRTIDYRVGDSAPTMGTWQSITVPISSQLTLLRDYVQFRIIISNILRRTDYEFLGIALKPWFRERSFTPRE